jgi:hypothetical protein
MTIVRCKNIVSANRPFKDIFIGLAVLFLTVAPTKASRSDKGPVELTIHPAKIEQLDKKYHLMVSPGDQIDADAVPLYEQAIKSIPKDFNEERIREWLKLPIEQFPQQQAEEALQKYLEPLKLVARAARCKECNWPEFKPGVQIDNLAEYRKIAFILELWARLEISRGSYEGAALAMRTGFGMARHLGDSPTIIQGLVGMAVGGVMCSEVRQFVQQKDSPNLYQALAGLPRPLIDMEKAIENEKKVGLGSVKNELLREQFEKQMTSSWDRTRTISKRLVNDLNGLQCVEAIRDYAATHDSRLPRALSDINQIEIPKDIMSGKAFEYNCSAISATLKSVIPESGNKKDAVDYVITLKK